MSGKSSSSFFHIKLGTLWWQFYLASSLILCSAIFLKFFACNTGILYFRVFSSCPGRFCKRFSRTYCNHKDQKLDSCIYCRQSQEGLPIFHRLQAPLPLSFMHSQEWKFQLRYIKPYLYWNNSPLLIEITLL